MGATTLVDLGNMPGAGLPTMGPNSFFFAHIFTEKRLRRRSTPHLRVILDLPLHYVTENVLYGVPFGTSGRNLYTGESNMKIRLRLKGRKRHVV